MFCEKCGRQNSDASKFCAGCGSPLQAPAPMQQAPMQQAPMQQAPMQQQAVPQRGEAAHAVGDRRAPMRPARGGYGNQYPQQQAWQQQAPYGAAPVAAAPAREGVIGAAWKDITGTPGWLKRVLLLCLVGCVPILNFAVMGYCIRWARELSFGKRGSMPNAIFKKREISTGFFAFLVALGLGMAVGMVAGVAFLLISGLFGLLNPVAGGIIGLVLVIVMGLGFAFAIMPVIDACVMRMSVVGYLESGFNFKTAFAAFRRNMGGLIAASIVPRIVVSIAGGIIVAIVMAILLALAGAAGHGIMNDPSGVANLMMRNPSLASGVAAGGVAIVVLAYLVCLILGAMCQVFSELFTYRAVGHWVARNAPEWAAESDEGLGSDDASGVGM